MISPCSATRAASETGYRAGGRNRRCAMVGLSMRILAAEIAGLANNPGILSSAHAARVRFRSSDCA